MLMHSAKIGKNTQLWPQRRCDVQTNQQPKINHDQKHFNDIFQNRVGGTGCELSTDPGCNGQCNFGRASEKFSKISVCLIAYYGKLPSGPVNFVPKFAAWGKFSPILHEAIATASNHFAPGVTVCKILAKIETEKSRRFSRGLPLLYRLAAFYPADKC